MPELPPLMTGKDIELERLKAQLTKCHRDDLEMALQARRIALVKACNDTFVKNAILAEAKIIAEAIRQKEKENA